MTDKYNWKLIGGLFIFLSYATVVLILAFARSLGIEQWSDLFSLGQLIFNILGLPAAVIGFVLAIDELRKTQATPKLVLYWESEPNVLSRELKVNLPKQSVRTLSGAPGGRPVIMNEGNAVAVWYLIHFDVPIQIYLAANIPLNKIPGQWILHAGEQSDWRVDILPEKMRVTFMSNGHVASYPDYPLPLGILRLPLDIRLQHATEYKIPYTIITDQGKPSHNSLTIQFVPSK